jgi:hypothetical protein
MQRQFGWAIALFLIVGHAALALSPSAPEPAEEIGLAPPGSVLASRIQLGSVTHSGSVYVPTYSHLTVDGGRIDVSFAVTLSIRNTSVNTPLIINRIDLLDDAGLPLKSHITKPIAIRAFGTTNLFLSVTDQGSAGAKFVVSWASAGAIPEPIIEAVMLGQIGGRSYSFVSRGLAVDEKH